jgi:transposase
VRLTQAQRKEFRALMWEFRRDAAALTDQERRRLEDLFARVPELRRLYEIKGRFKRIFDTAAGRRQAAYQLCALEVDALDAGLDLSAFFRTYERWQDGILAYFDGRQTSAVVEGINNKARVIVKRSYGLKTAESLWTRLILDLNWAKRAIGQTIDGLRALVAGFKALFSGASA